MTRSQTAAATQIRELNEQVKALTTQLEEFSTLCLRQNLRADQAEQKLADFEQSYAERLAKEYPKLLKQVEELSDENDELYEQNDELEKERDELQEQYDEQVDENAQLLAELEELRERNEELEEERDELLEDNHDKDQALRGPKGYYNLLAENAKLSREIARLEEASNPPPGFAGHKPKLMTPADFTRSDNA